jgi:20S proteasome alpha/beta subunit
MQERDIKPAAFGKLVSSLLYEKRFGPYFIEPVIAGLGEVLSSYIALYKQNLTFFEIRTINPTFSRAISSGRL